MAIDAAVSTEARLVVRTDTTVANQGQAYFRFPFISQSVANGNTFDTGLRITSMEWTAVDSGDYVYASADTGASVVTFTTDGGPHTGYLHVWGEPGQNAAPVSGGIVPDEQPPGVAAGGPMDGDSRTQGLQRMRIEFTSPSNGDTYDTGLQSITEVAAGNGVLTVTESNGTLTFHVPGSSPARMAVTIWHKGY